MSNGYDFSVAARREILAIVNYLDERSEFAGDWFLEDIHLCAIELLRFPNSGRAVPESLGLRRGMRYVRLSSRFESYLVFYRATKQVVRVMRVVHGARDIERVLKGP